MADKLDSQQFAYKHNRSTEDAVVTLMHLILKHLYNPKTTARALFLDFTSAFNTIRLELLLAKMVEKEVNYHLIHWYHAFFRNRIQIVKVNQTYSTPTITNIGAPQGCVSSPFIFTLYILTIVELMDQTHLFWSFQMILSCCLCWGPKTTPVFIRLIQTDWWSGVRRTHLLSMQRRQKKWFFGLPENSYPPPVIINNAKIEQVFSYKYLGIYVDAALSWSAHTDYICGKIQQRIYFLRRLRSFGTSKSILLLFFQSIVLSVMQYGGSVWYSCLSVQLKARLGRLISICSKIVGQTLEPIFKVAYTRRMFSLAGNILSDSTQILFEQQQHMMCAASPQAVLFSVCLISSAGTEKWYRTSDISSLGAETSIALISAASVQTDRHR